MTLTNHDLLEAIFRKIKNNPESITGLTSEDRFLLEDFRFFLDSSCWCIESKNIKNTSKGIKYIFSASCSPDERWGPRTTATVLTNQRRTRIISVDIDFK